MSAKIYFNPKCGTARNALALLREAGIEPEIIEYLKTPPSRAELAGVAKAMSGGARELLRAKEPLAGELGLHDASDEAILEAIAAHPVLLNRPVVVTAKGAKACRPAEMVKELI
ncbi:arsenate reductase (glutaredoxin) [Acidocella sp.]|uniref:arsenate reductase (glutaredoxin) n=1 Tax=Acidocella sp. TaxID=50710 RepID=UPI0026399588|nr:arsenate reductase (glutaredoxin) [Acidocella sp.]